jgi:hypothetical protein
MSTSGLPSHFPPPSDSDLRAGLFEADIGDWLGLGVNILMKDIGLYVLATLLYTVIVSLSCGLVTLILGPLMAGFYIFGLKRLKGEQPAFGDFFAGFRLFLPLFLLGLVRGLGISIGSMFLLLPGIYLAVAWTFSSLLVIDRKIGFWDAMMFSMKVVNSKFWHILGLVLLLAVVMSIASSFVVGFLFSTPFHYLVILAAYARIFGLQPGPVLD